MNFTEFTKRIYEMENVVCEIRETTYTISGFGAGTNIGRAEEYESSVEIMFENDEVLNIDKDSIEDIKYEESIIKVTMFNGTVIIFEGI